jgi:RNA polymerase sigma-70 factor (ECF subfamily)
MSERDLESLFIDFRERGDVAGLAQVFDRTSDELLTIALHLVPEPAQADDVVQATFLTAIQRAETFQESRALMPWLVGILANQAARARQARAQSIDPAKLETRVQPEPSDELERAEVAQILERAVDDLPEPYRAAVKRHVLDGERAVDIARQSGVAAGTVRMHILRGLEKLRRALPASLFAVGPWNVRGADAVRSTVLEAARAKARVLSASATGSTTTGITATVWSIGGLLMSIKILLGAGALAIGALVIWNLAPSHPTPSTPLAGSPEKEPALSEPAPLVPVQETETARQAASAEATAMAKSPTSSVGWWLTGTVTGLDGKPAEETVISVRRSGVDQLLTGHCDPTARFEIDVSTFFAGSRPAELLVTADHPANRDGNTIVAVPPSDVERGRTEHVEIETQLALVPFARLIGRVSAPGHAPDNCVVRLAPVVTGESLPLAKQQLSPLQDNGCFAFRLVKEADVLVRAGYDGLLAGERKAHVALGETTDVGLIELTQRGLTIAGEVRLPFDRGDIGLRVLAVRADARDEDLADGWTSPDQEAAGLLQLANVDRDGHFEVAGLTANTWKLFVRSAKEGVRVLWQEPVKCAAPASGVILGTRLGRVVVEVYAGGRPCAGVTVNVHPLGMVDGLTTPVDGRVTYLSDLQHDLDFDPRTLDTKGPRSMLSAAARAVDMVHVIDFPIVERGAGTLILVPQGTGLERLVLVLRKPDQHGSKSAESHLVDGKYTFAPVPAGHWKVEIAPPSAVWYGQGGGEFVCNERFDLDLADGQVITRPIAFVEGGRAQFHIEGWKKTPAEDMALARARVFDDQQHDVDVSFVVRKYDHGGMSSSTNTGSIQLDADSELGQALRPGLYELVLDSKLWDAPRISFRIVTDTKVTVNVPLTPR